MATPNESKAGFSRSSIRKVKSMAGVGSRISTTRGFVRRNVWIWPVVAIVALAVVTAWVRTRIEQGIKQQMEGELRALLDADVTALELWLRTQEDHAESVTSDPETRQLVLDYVKYVDAGNTSIAALLQAPDRAKLQATLRPSLEALHYAGYVLADRNGLIIASQSESLIGQKATAGYDTFIHTVLSGKPTVSRPFPSIAMTENEWGELAVGVPTMLAAAPVSNDAGEVVAVLALRIRPDREFTKILNVARFGETGETYAFDKRGVLLSQSRFEDQLKQIGLQVDQPKSRSILAVELRDPGVDLTTGARSEVRRADQPLTKMAERAVAGTSGVDVDGYRDYRGVDTIGAWTWLPQYEFGVATEIDKSEAFRPIRALRTGFWTLFGLLSATGIALLAITLVASRIDKKMRDAVIAAGKLGQYALEAKIGEGGMGSVYRARHAMLRRPTAVKLLEPAKTNEVAIARFEREVQMTSQLTHPNTITIYDYGRTDEGVFYYAMELLEGYSLQALVDRFGPQPDGRVIQILLQVCGSLLEAHSRGLMHRDIKPANIMLTRRAGVGDFAKLLDFGLVKAQDTRQQTMLTATDMITGTPLYMAPESISDAEHVDSRADLYALGAVAYFMLSGRPVFEANNVIEIIRRHVESQPKPLAEAAKVPVAAALDQLIMRLLEKSPDKRPASAAEMIDVLARVSPMQPWTPADAERWWTQHDPAGGPATTATQDVALPATVQHSGKTTATS